MTLPTHAPVLVTGGTGTLGRHVVPLLRAAGREVRVLTRNPRPAADGVAYVAGDLLTGADGKGAVGQGMDAALAGVEVVLHLAGDAKNDEATTRNLVAAAQRAGVKHLVYISVIGADLVPLGYFRAKHAAEQAVVGSGIPYTTLRAAQFHDLTAKTAAAMGKLPLVPGLGGMRWEPVDARDVAERLVELALAAPAGLVPDLAGPAVRTLGDLTRDYLAAAGKRRPMVPLRVPGKVGRCYREGVNLARPGADRGTRTWEAFLAETFPAGAAAGAAARVRTS
ncbi:NAD(P)H-binding protein [Streptomyces sp. NRRL S-495]|uniref:SDR family oxidoreductase n=1 Tax=Streptomyces sp. NRRL S-495 TaxID=1609133 RepID=UPI0005F960C2|nr:NAD(P)H-binding protein [Streptomyces sp. NRRL S-495]KJY36185.1 NmrA family transcriptional regulator [Streptomyces sp. NRRL S-495]